MHVINKSNCASTDCLMEETSLLKESVAKVEQLQPDQQKSSSSASKGEGKQVRIALQRKFPSEPNLRSCYFGINDESDGGVGGTGGVSDVLAAVNSSGVAGKVGVSLWDLVTIARATQMSEDSSREKIYSLNGTQQSMLTDDERPSMSPITKSTRRMPKYMQVGGEINVVA